MRTVPPTIFRQAASNFDVGIHMVAEDLYGVLPGSSWVQATLPVSLTGIGLRSATLHSPGAFIASLSASSSILSKTLSPFLPAFSEDTFNSIASLPCFQEALAMHTPLVTDPPSTQEALALSQKALSFAVDSKTHLNLLASFEGNPREQARLNSASLPHAGDWLNVIPNRALGLKIQSNEYMAAIKYRLGVPVYDTEGPCPACNRESDIMGDHAVGCHKQGELIT